MTITVTASNVFTNTWDATNRLTGTERDGVEILSDYNGVGDRVVRYRFEGPASLAIPLALDVAAGLPEVIASPARSAMNSPSYNITPDKSGFFAKI